MKHPNTTPNFNVNEIIDLASLAAKLQAPEHPAHELIHGKLQPVTQHLLTGYGGNGTGAQALSAALASDFATIISGPSIYDPARFDGMLTKKARESVAKDLQGQALQRCNRLLLECVFNAEIAKRFNGKKQVRIRVGIGMFRIQGENGIHGKIKIRGKSYSKKLTEDNEAQKAKEEYEKWVVEKRKEVNTVPVKKGTLKGHFAAFLAERQEEVELGQIKPQTIEGLKRNSEQLECHWPSWATADVAEIGADVLKQLRIHLLRHAQNRSIKNPEKSRGLSKGTYNSYIMPLAQLLRYLKRKLIITVECYYLLKEEIKYAKITPREIQIPTAEQLKTMRAYLYRLRQGPKCGDAGPKFDFMMLSGARRATANASNIEHYDRVNHTLLFTHLKAKVGQPTEKRLPICDELARLLDRLIESRGLKPGDNFFQAGNNNRAFHTAARKAGIEKWFHHACRHWFGTNVLFQTHDPINTAELMCQNDKGVTLLRVYRQVCTEHLQPTVRPLKLFPGANVNSTLAPTVEKAVKAVTKFGALPAENGAVVLDRVLWIEDRVDAGDFEAIKQLPALGQDEFPIYVRTPVRVLQGPTPSLIKSNFKYLLALKKVYHSDVAAETGISRSVIANVAMFGTLQCRYLPALCKYFGIELDEFLNSDLACPAPAEQPASSKSNGSEISSAAQTQPEDDIEPGLSVEEMIVGRAPGELCNIIARNIRSMMIERNLTPHTLSLKADLSGGVVSKIVNEETVPTEETCKKLAAALGVPETEIYDPRRDNIVVNRVVCHFAGENPPSVCGFKIPHP